MVYVALPVQEPTEASKLPLLPPMPLLLLGNPLLEPKPLLEPEPLALPLLDPVKPGSDGP
jgi:hypothetical protein